MPQALMPSFSSSSVTNRLASFRRPPYYSFANAANLNGDRIMHSDQMPSYFFAETLKYYYLLFSNAEPWPLNK